MLWTPDCPRIACWWAVPLARVEGGFNCVEILIGHAHTKALALHHTQLSGTSATVSYVV